MPEAMPCVCATLYGGGSTQFQGFEISIVTCGSWTPRRVLKDEIESLTFVTSYIVVHKSVRCSPASESPIVLAGGHVSKSSPQTSYLLSLYVLYIFSQR